MQLPCVLTYATSLHLVKSNSLKSHGFANINISSFSLSLPLEWLCPSSKLLLSWNPPHLFVSHPLVSSLQFFSFWVNRTWQKYWFLQSPLFFQSHNLLSFLLVWYAWWEVSCDADVGKWGSESRMYIGEWIRFCFLYILYLHQTKMGQLQAQKHICTPLT